MSGAASGTEGAHMQRVFVGMLALAVLAATPAASQEPPAAPAPPAETAPPPATPWDFEPPAVEPEPARAPGWSLELSVPVTLLLGHTTYRIEGSDGASTVASELEFPLESGALGLWLRLARGREPGRGGPVFELGGLLSIVDGNGKLKDSDWISGPAEISEVGAAHDGKDIYSTSSAGLAARVLEARAAWELDAPARGLTLAPFIGVLYQRFEYDVQDAVQVGYGPWAGQTAAVPGPVLDYRVSYLLPYLGGRAAWSRGSWSVGALAWFSPAAGAEDEDDHLLREKLSKTDASGSAWSATVTARFALGEHDALQAEGSLVRVEATGAQQQYFYGGQDAGLRLSIPSTITSSRASLSLAYTRRF